MTSAPLSGKRIVVTRPENQAAAMVELLQAAGAEVLHLPTIELLPPASWQQCDRAIEQIDVFDWLVFTSVNGVHFFLGRLAEKGPGAPALSSSKIAAVGKRTAEALVELGLDVELVPPNFRSESLGLEFSKQPVGGKSVLLLMPENGQRELAETLTGLGANVTCAVVYRNLPVKSNSAKLDEMISGQHLDVLTFTSPSTAENFVAEMGRERVAGWLRDGCKIAAIGSVTSKALQRLGLPVDICPPNATIPELVREIEEWFVNEQFAVKE